VLVNSKWPLAAGAPRMSVRDAAVFSASETYLLSAQ